jgi:8-oxo-dGTP diphosphatase
VITSQEIQGRTWRRRRSDPTSDPAARMGIRQGCREYGEAGAMKDEFVPVVSAVIRKEGKVLILRRREAFMGYLWEFPGGRPEDQETLQAGLERIIRDELGIEVEVGDYLCATGLAIHCELSIKSYVYESSIVSGAVTLKDHEEMRWVEPQELGVYDFAEHHKHVARVLMGEPITPHPPRYGATSFIRKTCN